MNANTMSLLYYYCLGKHLSSSQQMKSGLLTYFASYIVGLRDNGLH